MDTGMLKDKVFLACAFVLVLAVFHQTLKTTSIKLAASILRDKPQTVELAYEYYRSGSQEEPENGRPDSIAFHVKTAPHRSEYESRAYDFLATSAKHSQTAAVQIALLTE